MSIKKEFNDAVNMYCKTNNKTKGKITEPELVKILVETLDLYPNIKSKMYHQKYVNFRVASGPMRRELCDTLLIVKHKSYYRVSFVQNKKKIKNYNGLGKFKINCGQHYLLQKKSTFTPTVCSGIMPYVSNFIMSSKYDTVTTYSVFYLDKNHEFDLDLASACSVSCGKNAKNCNGCCAKTTNADHDNKSLNSNFKNTYIDYDSHLTLIEVEKYHEFGEVVSFKDFKTKLMPLLSSFNKDSISEFFGISRDTYDNNDIYQAEISKSGNENWYYYIPKLVLINIEK